jgi:fructooligosaccharide transport system substrate-binding protein
MKAISKPGLYLLVVLVILAMVMTACQPAAPAAEEPAAEEPAAEEPAAEEPAAEEPAMDEKEPVTLRLLSWAGNPYNDVHRQILDDFQAEYPWITVENEDIPWTEFFATITTQSMAGNLADVVAVDSPNILHHAYNGQILPLDGIFSDDELSKMNPALIDMGMYQGSLYGVAIATSACGMFYNVDMFADAGIAPPTSTAEAWTVDEARDYWKQLEVRESPDAIPTVWGIGGRGDTVVARGTYHGMSWIRSAGEKGDDTFMGMSPDGTTVDGYLNTPDALAAFQTMQDIIFVDKLSPIEGIPDMFPSGLSATQEWSTGYMSYLMGNFPDLKWGLGPLPYFKTGITHTGAWAYSISKDTEHLEESTLLLRWLVSEDTQVNRWQVYSPGYVMFAAKSVYEQIPDLQVEPFSAPYNIMFDWGQARPVTPGYTEYDAVIVQLTNDLAAGAPVEETVASAVADIDAALAAYK